MLNDTCYSDIVMDDVADARLRLFTGITLTDRVRAFASEITRNLKEGVEGIRWVPEENLHVTLKFLGVTEPESVTGILAEMNDAARGLPVEMMVGGVGGFPSHGSARIVYVGAEDPSGGLREIHKRLESGLGRLGFEREKRAYRPHITVGRARKKSVCLTGAAPFDEAEKEPLVVEGITLFRSVLERTGARYTVIETVRGEAGRQG